MKRVVINQSMDKHGHFTIPFSVFFDCNAVDLFDNGLQDTEILNNARTDERIIDFVIENSDKYPDLKVVEIPDEATDYKVFNIALGVECVWAVIDGKFVALKPINM